MVGPALRRRRLGWRTIVPAAAVGAVAAGLAWLHLTAPAMEPVGWRPAPVALEWGKLRADRDALSNPSLFGCEGAGPEATAVSPRTGALATGYADGTIRLFAGPGHRPRTLANTGGVPLGIGFLHDEAIVVADARRGLLRVDPDGRVTRLVTAVDGVPLRYADGLAVGADGRSVYFSDVSRTRALGEDLDEIVEHRGTGRLLRYDTATGRTSTLLDDLTFANGVALGPGDAYVLVVELASYRIRRYWLKGPLRGRSQVFADGLPGFPDNVTFNGRDRFWVGIHHPRFASVDALAGLPFLRRLFAPFLSRAIGGFDPDPRVVALDLSGRPLALLDGRGPRAYAPVTEAREIGRRLVLGSEAARCLASVPLPKLR